MNELPPTLPHVAPAPRRPLRGFAPVFAFGFRRVVRRRKVLLLTILVLGIGALVGYAIAVEGSSLKRLAKIFDRAILAFGLPLVALVLAADGFAVEVASRTLVYHLVRPVSRVTLFLARFLAGVIPGVIVAWLFLVVIVLVSGTPVDAKVWISLPVTAVAATLTLGAVYYTLGALFKHGLVIGLVYTFVFETLLTSVPGTMQKLSVMYHVRSLHHHMTEGSLPKIKPPSSRNMLMAQIEQLQDAPAHETALILLGITAVALAIGAWAISRRDWALKD